ncbi:MAG: hypothetical protein ACYC47_07395 [Desulfobacteria bacterium]|nr:hypothetical protein [Deltaproteobacteria bacterium]
MSPVHRELAAGRWRELTFMEQMANIGSEVERAIRWKEKGRTEVCMRALERALELLDMTVDDRKNRSRLKEVMRVREALADHFFFDNEYASTDLSWQRYFHPFAWGARAAAGR